MLRFLSKFINHSNWNNYLKYTNDTWVRVQHFAEKVKKEKRNTDDRNGFAGDPRRAYCT